MAIPTTIADLSTTAALNSPAGSDNLSTADDYLRAIQGIVKTVYTDSSARSETLTNKTVALGSNTVSGTTAQFNTALSDGDFATLAGTETLTNKALNGSLGATTPSTVVATSVTALTGIVGTTTNNSAGTGYVGEYIQSVVATTGVTAAANGVYKDLTSIVLTAGDWDVSFCMDIDPSGATATLYGGGIGTATGSSTAGTVVGSNFLYTPNGGAGANCHVSVPPYRISISSTTTYYAKVVAYYSAGTPTFGGRISARRVR